MSTTRHLINRRRRLAAASAAAGERTVRPAADRAPGGRKGDRSTDRAMDRTSDRTDRKPARVGARNPDRKPDRTAGPARGRTRRPSPVAADTPAAAPRDAPGRLRALTRIPAAFPTAVTLLAVLTVLLGGFAAWAAGKASALHDGAATANAALTDTARTSEVKGTVAQDVNSVFSYDYADTARTDQAAQRVLTGKAVQQYAGMIAQVKAQAPTRKLVLTTTVTDTGVEMIDGDRARVLVYADQSNTSTAKGASAGSTSAAAMFAVDVVHQGGTWKIASIDTFG
jgi:Mce-associated membrane protein